MTRVVSIVNVPHIGYSRILEDGSENIDQFSDEGIMAIWECEMALPSHYIIGSNQQQIRYIMHLGASAFCRIGEAAHRRIF